MSPKTPKRLPLLHLALLGGALSGLLVSSAEAQVQPVPPPQAPLPAVTDAPTKQQSFGIRLGTNFATLVGDDVDDTQMKSRTGFSFGGFMVHRMSPTFSIQPEVLFAMKGTALKSDAGGGEVILDYLQVPVFARFEIPLGGKVDAHVMGGPSIGVLLIAEGKQDGMTVDIKDDVSPIDFALAVGAGIDVPLQQGGLTFDLRYEYGLTSIDDTTSEADVSNAVLSFMGGYVFE